MTINEKMKQLYNDNDMFEEDVNFSDPEDFVDDISDEDLLGDLLRQKPKESDATEGVVIIDGLPKVGPDRIEKLKGLGRKLFKDFGTGIIKDSYPLTNDGKTKGFALTEFKDRASAEDAVKNRNDHKLDKVHKLFCYLLSDIEKYQNVPEKFVTPTARPYQDMGDLHYYLYDENCFDQFSVIHKAGETTSIYLNSVPEPTVVQERPLWTESIVGWSPRGTCFATFHQKGIALWGRDEFAQIQKFGHPGVQFIDFSPMERYIVTFSPTADQRSEEPKSIFVWDLQTGTKKRAFNVDRPPMWPVFKWSPDDKYFARLGEDVISVYETPSFGLLDKKSVKITGIKEFGWSPTDNTVAYWIAENKDVPAKVSLMAIPTRVEVRTKNLFNVAHCKMYWQRSGDYLCVKVARYTKCKKEKNDVKYSGIYYSFEIFHMREKGIPVDSIEIKENIIAFEWEPVDNKFAIISGESPSLATVTFFQVNKGQGPTELKKMEKRACNSIFWSPRGQFLVLAGLGELSGALEFIDTKDFTVMNCAEHFMVTDVQWDPTGRYVATVVSWWGHKVDNAYWMWNFQGKCLKKQPMDKLCQLLWRPRPPTPITPHDIKGVKKDMKKYTQIFEVQDKMRSSKASKEIIEKRQRLMKLFNEFRQTFKQTYVKEKSQRIKLRGRETDPGTVSDETMEEVVEFLVKKDTISV